MKTINELLKGRMERKFEFPFQILGKKMEKWFPKEQKNRLWAYFHKGPTVNQIRDAFKTTKRKGIKDFSYLEGIINNTT